MCHIRGKFVMPKFLGGERGINFLILKLPFRSIIIFCRTLHNIDILYSIHYNKCHVLKAISQ